MGPAESMSKSKKYTDPEDMINQFGADAVRLFILSDSPPEKISSGSIMDISSKQILQKYGI